MTVEEILQGIREGACDYRLDEVTEAVAVRRGLLNAQHLVHMTVGTRVLTNHTCRPAHRRRKLATIEEVQGRKGKVILRFDDRRSEKWIWSAPSELQIVAPGDDAAARRLLDMEQDV